MFPRPHFSGHYEAPGKYKNFKANRLWKQIDFQPDASTRSQNSCRFMKHYSKTQPIAFLALSRLLKVVNSSNKLKGEKRKKKKTRKIWVWPSRENYSRVLDSIFWMSLKITSCMLIYVFLSLPEEISSRPGHIQQSLGRSCGSAFFMVRSKISAHPLLSPAKSKSKSLY